MKLSFLGAAGVGKGTQAELLCQEKGLAHISTGDLLREAAKMGTETGVRARDYMDKGLLVPDEVVIAIIQDKLKEIKGFVLDGFPRTKHQAIALDNITQLDGVVYFSSPERVVIERLSGRRVCRNCAANYHLKHIPPKKENTCDKCGGELYQRTDDNVAAIRLRFKEYSKTISELLDFYEAKSILLQVDASHSPDETYKLLLQALPASK